jgi:predicted Rossmann fold nucleotide-binding protein DprA/Smf involved in DNA uptake
MKKLESQLKSVAKSLATLSKQVENASKQIGKLESAKSAPSKRTTAHKTSPKKKTAAKKTVAKKTTAKKTGVLESVYGIISRSKKGVNVVTLKSKTGFESKQISNALYKLSKRGQIKSASRGVYVKK